MNDIADIGNAITKFKKWVEEIDACGKYGNIANKKPLLLAIAALQEQAKREQGCDYCNDLVKYGGFPYREGSEIIYYCKKCGRKLEVE